VAGPAKGPATWPLAEQMLRFMTRRALWAIPVLIAGSFLMFVALHMTTDPVAAAKHNNVTPEKLVQFKHDLGLDRPLLAQYASFMGGALHGDLGRSLRTSQPVTSAIAERMPATLELAVAAMAVAVIIAIPLGILAAVRAGTRVDYAATTLALVGISMPNFWLGPLLAIVFAVELGWLPVSGRGTLAHLILPAVTLGASLAAIVARMTRASMLEELRELYVLAARARGVSAARAVLRHAFRNSLIPIVTVLGLQFGSVLTGAIITETIFAWPGVGRLLIQSITARDYPAVQGCILLIAITYVSVNLLVDVLYGVLDPRIRYE
jgi:peptide/nickel transport system permease protein